MYKHEIEKLLGKTIRDMGFVGSSDPLLSISEKAQFGDYSSNVALQLSKQKYQNSYQTPQEIANGIIEKLGHPKFLERVEVAGPGFLNFFIKDSFLAEGLIGEVGAIGEIGEGEVQKKIIVEYCDPNTHKMLHIGHLLQLTLGETMARLFEYQGHEVFRTNYGSDIGPTVSKCLWGIREIGDIGEIRGKSLREKAQFLGEAYAFAHGEYEKSLEVKEEIDQITNKLYQRDPEVMPLWQETKDWSLGYFETVYSSFGTLFDRRINESEVDEIGKETVMENIGKVFVKDDGAIIFQGERHNLHNRVFINSKGNPTYEGKEVGLAAKYQEFFQFDQLNIFSHKEQDDYFKVVIAVNEMIFPHLKGLINHVSYGEVRLPSGKMSSREGNIVAAEDILEEVKAKIKEVSPDLDLLSIQNLAVSAIKFAFLKYSVGSDLIYDVEESVSIHGDTGPYVMYVYARILSVIKKATDVTNVTKVTEVRENRAMDIEAGIDEDEGQGEAIAQKGKAAKVTKVSEVTKVEAGPIGELEFEEREILRQLEYFEFTIEKATVNFAPNELVKYLLNLTKAFNTFYEKHHIVGSSKSEFRLLLSKRVSESIKLGLYLLGIETVDKM